MILLGVVLVVNEGPELTLAKRNEEHKRAHIKDVVTSRKRRIREFSEQTNARSKQGKTLASVHQHNHRYLWWDQQDGTSQDDYLGTSSQ